VGGVSGGVTSGVGGVGCSPASTGGVSGCSVITVSHVKSSRS
tara:strand:- start:2990 stop:3115 length:126 start_codon:yes stop_codon:yes gene_type:complete